VIAGIGSFIFFDEIYYWPQILGFILIIIALVIMYYDRSIHSFHSQKYNQIPNEDDEKDFTIK
jgi:drug/metabolite transporter (DMT)-like permease